MVIKSTTLNSQIYMQLSYLLVTDLSFFCIVICILLILWNLLKLALGPMKVVSFCNWCLLTWKGYVLSSFRGLSDVHQVNLVNYVVQIYIFPNFLCIITEKKFEDLSIFPCSSVIFFFALSTFYIMFIRWVQGCNCYFFLVNCALNIMWESSSILNAFTYKIVWY